MVREILLIIKYFMEGVPAYTLEALSVYYSNIYTRAYRNMDIENGRLFEVM